MTIAEKALEAQAVVRPQNRSTRSKLSLTIVACIVATAILLALPLVLSSYTIGIGTVIMLTLPGALALNIVFGLCGQVSAGNAAFMALGAFTAAAITQNLHHAPALLVLIIAGLVGALGGLVVGIPAIRVRGLLLLISTLAFHYIILYAVQRYQTSAVGDAGFILPTFNILAWTPKSTSQWYQTFTVFGVLCFLITVLLRRSPLGRTWLSVRENDVAAEVLGVRVARAKLSAFVISSVMISVQGALFAYYLSTLQYTVFDLNLAIQYIAIVLIGGLGSAGGTAAGTVLIVALPYVLQSLSSQFSAGSGFGKWLSVNIFDLENLIYGALIVVFLLYLPDGLESFTRRFKRRAKGVGSGRIASRNDAAREVA